MFDRLDSSTLEALHKAVGAAQREHAVAILPKHIAIGVLQSTDFQIELSRHNDTSIRDSLNRSPAQGELPASRSAMEVLSNAASRVTDHSQSIGIHALCGALLELAKRDVGEACLDLGLEVGATVSNLTKFIESHQRKE